MILSILTQGRDPRCNALQSILGIFCHACNAPEKLVKVLSKMGVAISLESVRRATLSLSEKSSRSIQKLGGSHLASYGLDNFDLLLKAQVHTVDDTRELGMLHMTSGTLLPLQHGVVLSDLRYSKLLWDRSEYNTHASDPRLFNPWTTLQHIYTLHPDERGAGLSRRGEFRSWVFLRSLIEHGPEFFAGCADQISEPAAVDKIPVTKCDYVPFRAMDINLSNVSGNIKALEAMFEQAGVSNSRESSSQEPRDPLEDLSDLLTLVHGDLGTYERILTAIRRRSVEHTPGDRLQSVVFVMGLFHLKMAAADTIWRLLVTPDKARKDPMGFYKLAAKLRPKDSSHIVANAKFREQHELIGHVGGGFRKDAWRVEVKRRTGCETLEAWAATKPSLSEVKDIADTLALKYVEGEGIDFYDFDGQPDSARDYVRENTLRIQNYLLLYEELSYAMNAGDIGRVETVFDAWIPLFRAAGKHKYGSRTLRFMHSLYFVYPERLRSVIAQTPRLNTADLPVC